MGPTKILPRWSRRLARRYLLDRGFRRVFERSRISKVWIDVGAHLGETTLSSAMNDDTLLVFAFEPNWELARQIMARAANFVVLPMAVSDVDGLSELLVNACDGSSSLQRMREPGLTHWKELDLTVRKKVTVQTVRLDTFMTLADVSGVDYLKIDAEGLDLRVVQSAGKRLRDIKTIKLEVDVAADRLYEDAPGHDEVVQFMTENGFRLTCSELQNADRQENLTFESVGIEQRNAPR
ncbi:MAG: FkbM family methyltransferase [Candidatus Acidiferrales bacterium]